MFCVKAADGKQLDGQTGAAGRLRAEVVVVAATSAVEVSAACLRGGPLTAVVEGQEGVIPPIIAADGLGQ